MKIVVCGTNSFELLDRVSRHYNVKYIDVVGSPNVPLDIYKLGKVTYDYDNVENVVFNASVLDVEDKDIHPLDEQILLCALSNIDVVYLYTPYMSAEEVDRYHQYDEFFKGKIVDVVDLETFVI